MDAALPDTEMLLAHGAFVRAVARAALGGDEGVEDVVQETWHATLGRAPRHPGRLRAWLAGIARRRAARRLRTLHRERRHVGQWADRHRARSRASEDPAAVVEQVETGRRLAAAVLALPEHYRTAVVLRYYEALPPREIAKRLDVPVETVRTRVRRGLAELRKRLDDEGRRRGQDWRALLLPLVPALRPEPAAASLAALGATLMVKKIVVAVAVLACVAASWLWWRPWESSRSTQPRDTVSTAPDAGEARLRGRVAPTDPELAPGPAVDFARVDRQRDLHGIVVRVDGSPIPGAEVTAVFHPWRVADMATKVEDFLETREGPTTRTDDEGRFVLTLAPGDWAGIRIHHRGFARTELAGFQAGERVRVVLRQGVRLIVQAQTPSGDPVSALPLRLFTLKGSDVTVNERASTDDQGRALFEDLVPGTTVFLVALEHRDGWGNPGWVKIDLPREGEAVHTLRAPIRAVPGRVEDAQSGAPIPGAEVSTNPAFLPTVRTNDAGHFEWHEAAGAPTETLFVRADGYLEASRALADAPSFVVSLQRSMPLTGRVVDARGSPVPGARIVVRTSSGQDGSERPSEASTRSEEDGGFALFGVAADGALTLRIGAPVHGLLVLRFGADPDASRRDLGDVVLPVPCRILGTVRDAHGIPIAREFVELREASAASIAGANRELRIRRRTDDLGRFAFTDLAPGRYVVQVGRDAPPRFREPVELAEHAPEATLDLQEVAEDPPSHDTRALAVRVVDPSGNAVAGVLLYAYEEGRPQQLARSISDANGNASLQVPLVAITLRVGVALEEPFLVPRQRRVAVGEDAIEIVLDPAVRLSGTLRDPEGNPIPYATLRIVGSRGEIFGVDTDEGGAFLRKLPTGLVVDLHFDGLVRDAKTHALRRAPLVATRTSVSGDASDVELHATRLPTDRSLTIRVTDPAGAPVPGASVRLAPVEHRVDGDVRQTGADGSVVLEALAPWPLLVSIPYIDVDGAHWVPPAPRVLTPQGQEIELRFTRGAALEGTVEWPDGIPGGKAVVEAELGDDWRTMVLSSEAGHFVIGLPPGRTVTLRVSTMGPDGRALQAVRTDVAAGRGRVTLRLEPPESMR